MRNDYPQLNQYLLDTIVRDLKFDHFMSEAGHVFESV